uniref:KOW domain-containing protein n=1 Tax=Grammatophora oceanica TaxID=210454 RepID=A0A7S1YH02_9STRA|mmetsp:Transcript_50356/g.75269  ORF Transcript_50356/g.75269 Transcript_50356/m.75269 type:complete len:320 (+) Transcript_50356:65-1024(+)
MRSFRPFLIRWISTILALSCPTYAFHHGSVASGISTFHTTTCEMQPQSLGCSDGSERQASRRDFFAKVVLAGVAGLSVQAAPASADGRFPDLATVMGIPTKRKIVGLAQKIQKITVAMDELQRDLMQERWDLVETYPEQLRSFVPVLTTYTDSAYPSDEPTDKGLRVALRYEVGRFFASLERLRQATSRKALDQAYVAYSDMALHFDRYLRVGGLYSYYDDSISNEKYFAGISEDALVYSDPRKDPAEVRDLVILTKGPDKGKTGIVIAVYPDGSKNCVVKLDRFKGMREIRVVPVAWAGKRLGEQDPDDVFLIPRKSE